MSHWVWQSFAQYELSDEVESKLSKYHPVPICFLLMCREPVRKGKHIILYILIWNIM